MDIRTLSPAFAVTPQIHVSDIEDIKAQGFTHILCNRPSAESAPGDKPSDIEIVAKAAGLGFSENPVVMGQLNMDNVSAQKVEGKVLAYCASGTRSAIVWALSVAGTQPTKDILAALDTAGFPMPQLGPQVDALAKG
ncbi:TIGR01244 family sulfur transferase [Litoreibacter albidus]|uniref:TIGR01244 family protein n=1 Tax=Litoreibacter albidus TaxID=670155 RepID=A0A1H2Y971_9RHOB|nr:TIGR01244 family sulfur transferase [Litoreibacter albidus]SDX01600.1 TIGR01244 family protein [Litoreibacter albidus]